MIIDSYDWTLQESLVVLSAFFIAGAVKGCVGLGLPPIAVGVLVLFLPLADVAALLVLPSLATNIWQALFGGSLKSLLRALWPTLLFAAIGTLALVGGVTAANTGPGEVVLGAVLILYGIYGLSGRRAKLSAGAARWVGPLAGGATGLITASTGISAVPMVPYLQARGLSRDELVQAMGLCFTVSAFALWGNLALSGAAGPTLSLLSVASTTSALAGVWIGTSIRKFVPEKHFQNLLLCSLLALGFFIALRAML